MPGKPGTPADQKAKKIEKAKRKVCFFANNDTYSVIYSTSVGNVCPAARALRHAAPAATDGVKR